ncbi:unnamed protein product [Cylindrotheca closterium]|uniref:Uncharacterized protein n=1 Tax=Cylindrotheca closterium TaxID=2856 RepID=A0AAD2CT27_9STRA|nr:unnamed protein product [Cylindrotheca closterium]
MAQKEETRWRRKAQGKGFSGGLQQIKVAQVAQDGSSHWVTCQSKRLLEEGCMQENCLWYDQTRYPYPTPPTTEPLYSNFNGPNAEQNSKALLQGLYEVETLDRYLASFIDHCQRPEGLEDQPLEVDLEDHVSFWRQHGSCKRHQAIDLALTKRLTWDLLHLQRRPVGWISNDAKSCFDRIVHGVATTSLMRFGIQCCTLCSMFDTLMKSKHRVRTGFGDLDRVFTPPTLIPFQGCGQGNGAGPPIWVAISSILLGMMISKGFGFDFLIPVLVYDAAPDIDKLPHPAAPMLHRVMKNGAPVVVHSEPWSQSQLDMRVAWGCHSSANEFKEFLMEKFLDFGRKGFLILLPYDAIKDEKGLCLSPIGCVPQDNRRPRMIVDYLFWGLNDETMKLAPEGAMQFSTAPLCIREALMKANPDYGPVYMYKNNMLDGFYRIQLDGGLGVNHIGQWLGVSHRVGPMMTYWVLPKSGIPISVDTVQMVTKAEQQTDSVNQQMQRWAADVSKIVDAKSTYINWGKEEIPHQMMFDFDNKDDKFMRNFDMLINPEMLHDGDFEGTEQAADDLDAQDFTNMKIGLQQGTEGELQRAKVKQQIVDENGRPIGVASSNQLLDRRQYEVEYADGGTEIFAANILLRICLHRSTNTDISTN